MKIIMQYDVGDCCTYSATETVCLEYSSILNVENDFFELCEKHTGYEDMLFLGGKFNKSDFYSDSFNDKDRKSYYIGPKFMELEEWFAANKIS